MYDILMYIHLATVVPCIFIGAVLIVMKKRTRIHQTLGKIYMLLMLVTSGVALFMPAKVGSQVLGHFGWIHGFCLLTLYTVPTAYLAIRKGTVTSHKRKMILLYIGAIVIAGGFTLTEGRFLHQLLFG